MVARQIKCESRDIDAYNPRTDSESIDDISVDKFRFTASARLAVQVEITFDVGFHRLASRKPVIGNDRVLVVSMRR